MKHFITLTSIIILSFITINVYGQEEQSKIVDAKLITSSCTITKPIKWLTSPELGAYCDILKDGISVIIKWNPIGDGGHCSVSLKIEDEEIPINTWSDYNELKLIRVKMTNGHYNYTLKNSMFFFFNLVYIDDGYVFNSTLEEID